MMLANIPTIDGVDDQDGTSDSSGRDGTTTDTATNSFLG